LEHRVSPLILLNEYPAFKCFQFPVWLKYDALNSSPLEGNKFWKLFALQKAFKEGGYKGLVSFGGAFSNHIFAVAQWAKVTMVPTVVYVRGYRPPTYYYTLRKVEESGIEIRFVHPTLYRSLCREQGSIPDYKDYFVLPEGGAHPLAVEGIAVFYNDLVAQFESMGKRMPQHIALAAGTGSTAAALQTVAKEDQHIHIFNVVQNSNLNDEMDAFLEKAGGIARARRFIYHQYNAGKYGKVLPEHIDLIFKIHEEIGIHLDPIYNVKMFLGMLNEMRQSPSDFSNGVLLWHTGGRQGIKAYNEMHGTKLPEPGGF
jgi:1-aminocyclopropane-1-carboxylate deaminase